VKANSSVALLRQRKQRKRCSNLHSISKEFLEWIGGYLNLPVDLGGSRFHNILHIPSIFRLRKTSAHNERAREMVERRERWHFLGVSPPRKGDREGGGEGGNRRKFVAKEDNLVSIPHHIHVPAAISSRFLANLSPRRINLANLWRMRAKCQQTNSPTPICQPHHPPQPLCTTLHHKPLRGSTVTRVAVLHIKPKLENVTALRGRTKSLKKLWLT